MMMIGPWSIPSTSVSHQFTVSLNASANPYPVQIFARCVSYIFCNAGIQISGANGSEPPGAVGFNAPLRPRHRPAVRLPEPPHGDASGQTGIDRNNSFHVFVCFACFVVKNPCPSLSIGGCPP